MSEEFESEDMDVEGSSESPIENDSINDETQKKEEASVSKAVKAEEAQNDNSPAPEQTSSEEEKPAHTPAKEHSSKEEKEEHQGDPKKQLIRKSDVIHKKIADLKPAFETAKQEKEALYEKKEKLRDQIREILSHMGTHKKQRNELTVHVKEKKKQREELTHGLKEKISAFKELETKKEAIVAKHKISERESPLKIKAEIEALEYKIETQPMSFDNEQKLMKRIKELKKKYGESKEVIDILDASHNLSKEIKTLKRETNSAHRNMQDQAEKSQKEHLELVALGAKVDELKKEEEETYKAFFEAKKKYSDINEEMKGLYKELGALDRQFDGIAQEKKARHKEKQHKDLKQMEIAVEEKIKKKMKLTTEDLLVFQGKH